MFWRLANSTALADFDLDGFFRCTRKTAVGMELSSASSGAMGLKASKATFNGTFASRKPMRAIGNVPVKLFSAKCGRPAPPSNGIP